MSAFSLALIVLAALAFLSLGALATFAIGRFLPEPVCEAAQRHGRFAGLESDSADGGGPQGGVRPRAGLSLPAPLGAVPLASPAA